MKRILIADDDSVTRSMLSRVLKPFAGSLEILTAGDGKEATRMVDNHRIDMIIADLQLPTPEGFDLPAYIKQKYPGMPLFLMTAFGTPELRNKIEAFSHTRYFEKPLNVDVLKESILKIMGSQKTGRINAVSLGAVLQTAAREGWSNTLLVQCQGRSGKLFLVKGELIAAETDTLKAEAAALEMLNWRKTVIVMENPAAEKARDIQITMSKILTDGLKLKGEKMRPAPRPSVKTKPRKGVSWKMRPESLLVQKKPLSLQVNGIKETRCDLEQGKGIELGSVQNTDLHKSIKADEKEQPGLASTSPPDLLPEERLSLTRLANFLIKSHGILGFRIYDEQDILKAKYDKNGYCTKLRPAVFWNQADELKTEIDGGILQYLVISTQKGIKYTIIQHHRRRIVIAAQPGYKTSDLVKALV